MDKLVKRFVALSISSRLTQARSRLTPGASQMAPVNLWNISGSPRESRVRMIVIRRELAHLRTGNASVSALQAM
jgi:hypothetical protein